MEPAERAQRRQALAEVGAALRQRAADLALGVADVEDQLAAALERRAETSIWRADELRARAAAARRYAETERVAARRFSAG